MPSQNDFFFFVVVLADDAADLDLDLLDDVVLLSPRSLLPPYTASQIGVRRRWFSDSKSRYHRWRRRDISDFSEGSALPILEGTAISDVVTILVLSSTMYVALFNYVCIS